MSRLFATALVVALSCAVGGDDWGTRVRAQATGKLARWYGKKVDTFTSSECQSVNTTEFLFLEDVSSNPPTWVSRKERWNGSGTCSLGPVLAMQGGRREPVPGWRNACRNRGSHDFERPIENETVCEESFRPLETTPLPLLNPSRVFVGPVGERSGLRDGCRYDRRQVTRTGNVTHVSVEHIVLEEGDIGASVFTWSQNFVPSPGAEFHIAARSPVPVRWMFVITESSRLRGYATNADIDLAFFELFNLPALRGRYGNMDPDLIFDPARYESQPTSVVQTGSMWKRPRPDTGPKKWSILETSGAESSVDVTVTAMDFGAHGELQVYVAPGCEGGWRQLTVDEKTGANGFQIPVDADGNFIADPQPGGELAEFKGRPALEDVDNAPVGNGTRGDGFTAFEEYRGFVTHDGPSCSPLKGRHVRTAPSQKDLFVRPADPLFWMTLVFMESAMGPTTHGICPQHYGGDNKRIVNFTMQIDPGEGIRGARLTQNFPQHGLRLVNESLSGHRGAVGMSIGRQGLDGFGPPRQIDRVVVDVGAYAARLPPDERVNYMTVAKTVVHEIGHAIGIRHHGDDNLWGPVVLLGLQECPRGMEAGTVAGERACATTFVAVRGAQNSGKGTCPMRYEAWRWYLPEGVSLSSVGNVDFSPERSFPWTRRRGWPGYMVRVGQPLRYNTALEEKLGGRLGSYCHETTGTGINALPGAENHAGDASRFCSRQMRVNDRPD
jgi:hypothetical protein